MKQHAAAVIAARNLKHENNRDQTTIVFDPARLIEHAASGRLFSLVRSGRCPLQHGKISQRVIAGFAAHLGRGLQAAAAGGAFRLAKNGARKVDAQMTAGFACRLGEGGDRRGDAAGAAAGTACRPASPTGAFFGHVDFFKCIHPRILA